MNNKTTLYHLASSVEEILDSLLEEARSRGRQVRELHNHLERIESQIELNRQRSAVALVPAISETPSGLVLNGISLRAVLKLLGLVIPWAVSIGFGVYQAIHAFHH